MSYSRSSYRSSTYKYSSEGVSDDSFTRSSLASSTRSSIGLDESTIGRTSRFTSSITGSGLDDLTSTRRTSLRGSRFDDDDTGYSSFRRTSRTSSRGDDDDLGLTSYRRRTSGLSEDDDSLSFRRTKISSSYELEDTGHSYKSRQLKSTLESASDSAYSSYLKYGKTSHETATEEAVEAKPGDIFVAVLDYDPPKSDTEGIPLKEGQEVECLDTSKPRRWQVKTRPCSVSQEISEGWVPSCYLEKKADASESITDPKFQEAKTKRE